MSKINTNELKRIFRHYKDKSEPELKSALRNIKRHTLSMKRIGIHTTPAHEQSIKYHLAQKSNSLIKKKKQ